MVIDLETMVKLNSSIVGIITSLIAWGGVITLFIIFRNFFIVAITRAFIQVFEDGNEKTKQILARYLIDKNSALSEIYANLKKYFDGSSN